MILITYTYFKSPSSDYNLSFYVKHLKYRIDIDYIIVINGFECSIELPNLQNLKVIKRENTGFDFGGHGIALKSIDKQYDYYFFMNSGVIGPILKESYDWHNLFIDKINDSVKLVGTSIVCLPEWDLGGFGPKVEGFFFCTDQIGLDILIKNGIFNIHPTKIYAILHGEYAMSTCILKEGYNIACMIYENIDFRDPKNYRLNNNQHPSRHNSFYGKSIDPYRVIFHKWHWEGCPTVSFDTIKNYCG